jgi:ABC-type transport system involved in cytochrome c biogenesis permease component
MKDVLDLFVSLLVLPIVIPLLISVATFLAERIYSVGQMVQTATGSTYKSTALFSRHLTSFILSNAIWGITALTTSPSSKTSQIWLVYLAL